MMMIKSSWRIFVVLLLSFSELNTTFTQEYSEQIQQQDNIDLDLKPPYAEIPTQIEEKVSSYSHQQSNKETIFPNGILKGLMQSLNLPRDSQIANIVGLYEKRVIQLISEVKEQRKVYDDFRNRQAFAVKPSSRIIERQTIENLETSSITIYSSLIGEPIVDLVNSPTSAATEKLSRLAQSLRATINRINKELPQIVVVNRNAHVNFDIHFNLKHTNRNEMKLISRSVNVDNIDPSNLLDNLVYRRRSSRRLITGQVHLTKGLSVNRISTGTVNHLNLARDVVYKGQTELQIKSRLRVGSLSGNDISTRSLDQVDPNDLIFLNSQSHVIISSPLFFDSLVNVNNSLNVPTISGVHLPTFRSSVFTYNSDQVIQSPIYIRSVQAPSVQLKDRLNGLDYNRRIVRLLRADLPIKARALIITSKSFRAHDFNLRSLNNQRFPDDFLLVNSDRPQTIPMPINFNNLRITRDANVNGLINGLRYPDSFVTLDGNETVNSNLIFSNSITFNRDITSENYIGKHRLSDLVDWVYGRNPVMKQLRDNPSGNVVVKGDLQVTSTINELKLNSLLNDLVHLAEPNVVQVTGTKTFVNSLHVPSITIREINRSPLTDFASSRNPAVSPIRFVNPLVINNLIWKSTGKSNRITDLINKRISLVHEGTINGDIFVENMLIKSLEIDPLEGYRINNLSSRQLVFSRNPQHIHGPLTFTDVTFLGPIRTTKLNIDYTMNKRDIKRVMKNSVNPRKQQNFSFERLVLKNCRVNSLIPGSGDWRVHSKLLIGSLRNLLLKNSDQVISSRKRFLYQVSFSSHIKSRSSRGVLLGMQKGPLFLPSDLVIKHNLRLSDLMIHGNLQIKGKLNGIDLSVPLIDLQSNHNGLYSMTSPQSFYSGLAASRIQVNYINGVPFDKYWSKRKPLEFRSPVTVSNLIIDGPVHLNGLVNNYPIVKIINQIRSQQNHQSLTIQGDVVFKSPIIIRQNLNVSGKINSVNFDWLTRSLAKLSTIKEIIGVKTFKSVEIKGNLHVKRLNSQQLSDFFRNIVLIHPNKGLLLASPVEFSSMTTIRENINSERLRSNFNSHINGINMKNLLPDQMHPFKRQSTSTTIVFTDPVYIQSPQPIRITGKVNNLDLKRDIIWLNDYFQPYQRITGNKFFKRAHFMSNVYVHSSLNGIDKTDRLKRIIDPRTTQNITENVKFGGKMILNSGLFVSMIGNVPASSLVVTNQPFQSIIRVPARWTFNGPSVVVKKDLIVDGRIKNVSLNGLIRFSMKKHIPQTINVPMKFDRVVLKSVVTNFLHLNFV